MTNAGLLTAIDARLKAYEDKAKNRETTVLEDALYAALKAAREELAPAGYDEWEYGLMRLRGESKGEVFGTWARREVLERNLTDDVKLVRRRRSGDWEYVK
jgi:hypothetical protein